MTIIAGEGTLRLTADSLAKFDQLLERELIALDAADKRPLAFVFNCSDQHIGEVLNRGERDANIITALHHEQPTVVEVDGGLQGLDVFG